MTDKEAEKNRKVKLLREKYAKIIDEMDVPERPNFLDGGQSPYTEVLEAYKKEYAEIIKSIEG